jgi:hypothetical protein
MLVRVEAPANKWEPTRLRTLGFETTGSYCLAPQPADILRAHHAAAAFDDLRWGKSVTHAHNNCRQVSYAENGKLIVRKNAENNRCYLRKAFKASMIANRLRRTFPHAD